MQLPFELSSQAKLVFYAYLVIIVSLLLPIKNESYNAENRFVGLLFILVPILLSVYSVNCMVIGASGHWSCEYYASFSAGLLVLWAVVLLVVSIYAMVNGAPQLFVENMTDKKTVKKDEVKTLWRKK
jgi:hypothetical protein